MGEKEVREAYTRFTEEIAPIFASDAGPERALGYLQMLAGVRLRLFAVADNATNDSARVGALREVVKVIREELELSRSLGLIPRARNEVQVVDDGRWLVEQVAAVLQRHRVSPDAIDELRSLTRGDGGV